MKLVIKSISSLFLVALVASCATGDVVTDSPPLPNVPQPTQTTQQTPTQKEEVREEKMETRSSGTPVFNLGTVQRNVSSEKSQSIKNGSN